jgi:O-methyltransferase domain/Dimerisation domain
MMRDTKSVSGAPGTQRDMHIPREPRADELPMVDVHLPMMKSAALISAGQLGLFQALAGTTMSVPALAAKIACSVDGVRRLADFLTTIGYLELDGENVRNSEHARRWFTRDGEVDYTAGLRWTGKAWNLMGTLSDCVRTGAPNTLLWDLMRERPAWGASFSNFMHAFARHLNADLLHHVRPAHGARRLLDLGGSHGEHSIGFCRLYPELEAVLVDHESALTETETTIEKAGMTHRITLTAGDLREAAWGERYDVVLFLSVVHNQTAEQNRSTVQRIADVLTPGGMLVIHEYPHDLPSSAVDAAFRLTLLTETGTSTASSAAIEDWIAAAGLGPVQRIVLDPPEKGALFLAHKR